MCQNEISCPLLVAISAAALLKVNAQGKNLGVVSPGGHSIVKNTGGWFDSLGSGILVGKDILGLQKY